jgi:hypothetical protein
MLKLLLALMALQVLGCASWSYSRVAYKHLCKDADWEQLFYEAEINKGRSPNIARSKLDVLEAACPYHNIQPDMEAKAAALERVRKEFCAFDNAYSYGRAGNQQPQVCPSEFNVEWRRGYRDFLVLQLEYLHKDGTYKAVMERHLRGMNVKKKDIFAYNLARSEAEVLAIKELKIKPVGAADEAERKQAIEDYTKELDEIRRQPH